jgi:hypothetical protein
MSLARIVAISAASPTSVDAHALSSGRKLRVARAALVEGRWSRSATLSGLRVK